MQLDNLIVVFDIETNGLDIKTLDPVEIACVALDPNKLTIVPGSKFHSLMRPEDLESVDNTDEKKDSLNICKITKEMLKDEPITKVVISAFVNHIKKICGKKKAIPCGYNISNFDLPLLDRLCNDFKLGDKNGKNPCFLTGTVFDLKEDINRWFFQSDRLLFPSFDSVRKLMGMKQEGAHRADFDVAQEAWLAKRLLSFYKKNSPLVAFEGAAYSDGGILS